METDEEWKKEIESVNRIIPDKVDLTSQKVKPSPAVRKQHKTTKHDSKTLGSQFEEQLNANTDKTLRSTVYNNTGTGIGPVSGGKTEGKKRTKM